MFCKKCVSFELIHNNLVPELFLGVVLLYILLYGLFMTYSKNYPLIALASLNVSVIILFLSFVLFNNDYLNSYMFISFNKTIVSDVLSNTGKFFILGFSILWFLMIKSYIIKQRLNNYEYFIVVIFSIIGMCIMCSANDLLTIYLSLELQSLSFYVLAGFKRKSVHSVDAGLKYYVLGSLSSCLFLFGSSMVYGLTGTINLQDFKNLFFWATPSSFFILSNLEKYHLEIEERSLLLRNLYLKLIYTKNNTITEEDGLTIYRELAHTTQNFAEEWNQNYIIYKYINDFMTCKFEYMLFKSGSPECFYERSNELFVGLPATNNYILGVTLLKLYASDCIAGCYVNNFGDVDANSIAFLSDIILEFRLAEEKFRVLRSICSKLEFFVAQSSYQYKNIFNGNLFNIEVVQFVLIFIFSGLFLKLAIAPFHAWLPDVYEGSPTSSSFFFSVISKFPIFVIVLRIFLDSFYVFVDYWRSAFVFIAIFSIFICSIVGIRQFKLKSLMAYSSIIHMSNILLLLCAGTSESVQIFYFYFFVYLLTSFVIWSVITIIELKIPYRRVGAISKTLSDLSLLYNSNKLLTIVFSFAVFSIAGLPPLIGFLAKFNVLLCLIQASMDSAAILVTSFGLISTFFYLRIIKISHFENVKSCALYYPINYYSNTLILSSIFIILFYISINPMYVQLFFYKSGILFFK